MWTREELKTKAKETFKRNYWGSVLAGLAFTLFVSSSAYTVKEKARDQQQQFADAVINMSFGELMIILGIILTAAVIALAVGAFIKILVVNPLEVGIYKFFEECELSQEKAPLSLLFHGFKNSYGNIVVGMFLTDLYVWLWSLLLIIPGIYKRFQWLMVPYILADHPSMDSDEARKLSAKMMDGHKWNSFVLGLSFIGWYILGSITFNILNIFYVVPYYHMTFVELYLTLKEENQSESIRDYK